MEEIWIAGMDWDEELSMKIKSWFMELPELCRIRVPRCLQIKRGYICYNLSRCLWSSCSHEIRRCKGNVILSFVASKTRVAPQ